MSQSEGLYAHIKTNRGEIVLSLAFDKTPITVANFVALAEGNMPNNAKSAGVPYYDGIKFHRVIPNFMIQTGDPEGTGRGGPGYKFADEFDKSLRHNKPGILSMANAGPGTNGSQFFITHVDTGWLDDKHTVFGHVVAGQEVVNAIAQNDVMETVTIKRVGAAAEGFDAMAVWKDAERITAEKNAAAAAEAAAAAAKYLEGTTKTASGLAYKITEPGTGKKPAQGQQVSVHYRGMLTNGSIFDSSFERGQPIRFPVGVGHVIPGWDEGIMLLDEGTSATFVIPANLGYGAAGAGGVIPPNATLVFEVKLVKIG